MITLKGWKVRDYLTFGDTDVSLAHDHGLYVVHGENKDSRVIDNTNAVGKSRLLSILPTILFESDPLALTNSNKKDVLRAKSSMAQINLETHSGKEFCIQQTPSKYFIGEKKKGKFKDLEAIKLDVARSKIKQIFPLSRNTFYATCYIQAQRDCGFQRAVPRDRLKYITDLFGLNVFDELHKEFKKQLSNLAKTEVEYKGVAQLLNESSTTLADLESKLDKSVDLKATEKKAKKITDKLNQLYKKQGALSQSKSVADKHTKLTARVAQLEKSLKKLKVKAGKSVNSTLKSYVDQLDQAKAYTLYAEALDEYKSEHSALSVELESLSVSDRSLDEIEADYEKLQRTKSKLVNAIEELEESRDAYEIERDAFKKHSASLVKLEKACRSTKLFKAANLGKSKPSTWLKSVTDIVSLANTTVNLWSKLHKHSDLSECPVCGNGDVDFKRMKKRSEDAEVFIEDHLLFEELDDLLRLKVTEPKKPTVDDKLESKLSKVKKSLKQLAQEGKDLEARTYVEKALDRLKKPKKVPKPSMSVSKLKAVIENLTQLSLDTQRIRDMEPSLGLIEAGNLGEVEAEIKSLTKKHDKLSKVIKYQSYIELGIDHETSLIEKYKAKLEELEPMLQERNVLKALVSAYTPKNLKLQAAEKILMLLEDSLNRYSNLVYLEPMRFEIRATENGISATAIRNNGDRSDIIHLSGAESNCFRLLFAVSLLPLLPENMRTNFLILDEPDGACSDPVREHLITEFLPKLREIVPHVFWITPKTIDSFENCTVLKIIKEDGISRLEA